MSIHKIYQNLTLVLNFFSRNKLQLFLTAFFFNLYTTYSLAGPWIPKGPEFYLNVVYNSPELEAKKMLETDLFSRSKRESASGLSSTKTSESKSKFKKKLDKKLKVIKEFINAKYSFNKLGVNLFMTAPITENFSTSMKLYSEKDLNIFEYKNKIFLFGRNSILCSLIIPIVEVVKDDRFKEIEKVFSEKYEVDIADEIKEEIKKRQDRTFCGLGFSLGKAFRRTFMYMDFGFLSNKYTSKINLEIGYGANILHNKNLKVTSITKTLYNIFGKMEDHNFSSKANTIKSLSRSSNKKDMNFIQEVLFKFKSPDISVFLSIGLKKVNGIRINKTYGFGFNINL